MGSSSEFAKKLEHFFGTFPEPIRLYYERRDGQYDRVAVEKSRIVSPQTAIKAFVAMFLDEPHTTTKNYKSLRRQVGNTIFAKIHRLEPYYVSAFTAYKLEQQYRAQKIGTEYKSARYHFLLVARLLLDPDPLPPMNSNDMKRRCTAMIEKLSDQDTVDVLFQDAKNVIDEVSLGDLSRDNIRTITTTQSITKALQKV